MSAKSAIRILVVDDNEPVRYATSRMLHKAGYEIIEADDGTTALAQLRVRRPDLVVLDIKLPDISGYEVCQRIKADPETAMISVLHLSAAYVDSKAKVVGLESGADAYLTHPVSHDELLATVKALLRIRMAEEEARRQAEKARAISKELEQVIASLGKKTIPLRHW